MKTGRPKTKKQQAFFENLAAGMTQTEAAKKAGYREPGASGHQLTKNYTDAFRAAFAKQKFTIPKIVEKLIAGTNAMRESFDERTGEWKDVDDWNSRHKYLDTIIKVQGFYPNEKHEVTGKDGGPIIDVQYNRTELMSALSELMAAKKAAKKAVNKNG